MNILRRLWLDDRGATSPVALILTTTIAAIGATVGLATLRMHIVQQMGDIAVALESLDQSFSYTITTPTGPPLTGSFDDPDPPPGDPQVADPDGDEPACLDVTVPPAPEMVP